MSIHAQSELSDKIISHDGVTFECSLKLGTEVRQKQILEEE